MLFKVFPKSELETFYDLLAVNQVIAPVKKATAADGAPLMDFDFVSKFKEIVFDYQKTLHSLKKFYLPYQETLCTFKMQENNWEKQVEYNIYKPLVYFGVHACDINAMLKLDKVLSGTIYPDPFYTAKRKNMFIVGVNCKTPGSTCFCRSMGTDTAIHGFDIFLTEIGTNYFAEIFSANAYTFINQLSVSEPSEEDHILFREVANHRSSAFRSEVDTSDLTKILDLEFQAEVWKEWGDKCLSCGTCANVCPTCYCYGVEENVDLDLQGAVKTKRLHSCNLVDFAQVAGGFNFRPEGHVRLKYRFYHKHRGFVETFEESLCVGCGRCGDACLAGITVPKVIASVREGEQ